MEAAFSRPEPERDQTHLLVMLHGYGTDETRMESLFATLPAGFTAAAPRATLDVGGDFGWYLLNPALTASSEQILEATGGLLVWLDSVTTAHDYASVSVLGFSQGMAMATMMLRMRPETFRCVVGLCGFVPDVELLAVTEPLLHKVPYLWQRGTDDLWIHEGAVESTADWLQRNTYLTAREWPGVTHQVTAPMMVEVDNFLREHVLGEPA